MPQVTSQPPTNREDFEVAIICALPLEYDAVCLLFDEFWDEEGDRYGRALGDMNQYTTGRIGKHNIVLALLSHMGVAEAAGAAASLRSSYSRVRLALLVGVCGGVPFVGDTEILLGDVVISDRLVRYRYGRQYPDIFQRKNTIQDGSSKPNKDISGLLALFNTARGARMLQERTAHFLKVLQVNAMMAQPHGEYQHPGILADRLFKPDYRHKHGIPPSSNCYFCWNGLGLACEKALNSSCEELGCDLAQLVPRKRFMQTRWSQIRHTEVPPSPIIHVGSVASGDVVMKSGEDRDEIGGEEGIIAFEMEGAGMWEEIPSIIIKGVCNYADCHKNKIWQNFADATAAAASKAVLERYIETDYGRIPPSPPAPLDDYINAPEELPDKWAEAEEEKKQCGNGRTDGSDHFKNKLQLFEDRRGALSND
ncbi:nucleoside phosphorylase domain-containing protein [Dactylonectria estremocensis]|uniref:Nucleoside phosphorylase domain-containing protein n=1 Tax=Dactylonectria estremocensis TaxID=1079267 RepID=A0A9P9EMF4_9HYPO|nr:nucleoside phosphorylase domain-containing protein [Dactylonectria estremocensis]